MCRAREYSTTCLSGDTFGGEVQDGENVGGEIDYLRIKDLKTLTSTLKTIGCMLIDGVT